ncbi:MAG: aspartate/glutamate racemase family protein [Paracoccaceae bacterium]
MPSRIAHPRGRGHRPAPVLAEMARRLEAAGATALGMPCNTAHHYARQIAAAVSIPFLNMVELSVARAAGGSAQETAASVFLASPAVRKARACSTALARAGLTAIWPEDDDRMLGAIRLIKSAGPVGEAQDILAGAARELVTNGAALIFVACSEFSLLAGSLSVPVPVIDTVDVLVDAIRAHSLQK